MDKRTSQRAGFFRPALAAALLIGTAGCRAKPEVVDLAVKARAIHHRILTVDTHCDTAFNLLRKDWKIGDRHDPALRSSGKIDLPRMAEGGLDAALFAAFVAQGPRTPEGNAKARKEVLATIDAIYGMAQEYPGVVGIAVTPDDAYRLKKAGKRAAYIGIENGYAIGNDLGLLGDYFGRGVRYVTLCHTKDNDLCDSSTDSVDPEDRGLSAFGREAVRECNRLGMLVDVSHASDRSFFDVLGASEAPVIASHSCARAVCDNPRNLTDDMLKALAKNGGVIQMCFLSNYVRKPSPNPEREKALKALEEKYDRPGMRDDEDSRRRAHEEYEAIREKYPSEKATVRDLVDHIDHVVGVVGIDHVGIGTDFDGGGGVIGCDDVSGMVHVTEELLRRGYSEKDIAAIWSGNFMRVFRKAIEVSERLRSS
ncbi:MAG TPA: dipeptidase [Acidobacteriota bacterium]|nr:dipeptidase [Acidobacteriota bacterium]